MVRLRIKNCRVWHNTDRWSASEEICGDKRDLFECTRPKGHSGFHHSHSVIAKGIRPGEQSVVCNHRWARSSEFDKK